MSQTGADSPQPSSPTPPEAPRDLRRFLALAIQALVLLFVVREFQLETPLFHDKIMPLVVFGFLVHYLLPLRHRLPFFLLLSLAGILLALGFPNGLWLLGPGLLLVAACHLPLPFAARVALVVAIAAGLALLRLERFETSWSASVLPILASMFMFRIILYLYDLKHGKAASLPHTLAYFFLLPNVAFPIFPVIDYSTFRRTYYDGERNAIHQRGLRWMLLGIIQLFAYRYIYHFWLIAPEHVTSLRLLLQHAATEYLTIFRVMGQYNLIVGMLLLFGFNLPPILERFFLAHSFTEFWRRANIYWKDFLQKVFFYPLYFKLRRLKPTPKLVVSTAAAFAITWALHAYQSFWIRGAYHFLLPDLLFWAIFGSCVVVNAVYESQRGRRKPAAAGALSLRDAMGRALGALLLFAAISFMWLLWNSPSVGDFVYLLRDVQATPAEILELVPLLLLAYGVFLAGILLFERTPQDAPAPAPGARVPFFRRAGLTAAASVFLLLLGSPLVSPQTSGETPEVLRALQGARLNAAEYERLTRGYYEDLNAGNPFNESQLADLMKTKEGIVWPPFRDTEAGGEEATFIRYTVLPSVHTVFHGAPLSTNRWAIRDQDYEREKPPGVYRIAILGGSIPFGSGVANHQVFEAVLEDRLNLENHGGAYRRYEVLNFSIPAHSPLQEFALFEEKVLAFQPDMVLHMAMAGHEDTASARHLANVATRGIDIPYPALEEIVRKAQVDRSVPFEHAFRRLNRYSEEILRQAYPRFVRICRENHALPVFAFSPTVMGTLKPRDRAKDARIVALAEQSGFLVLDVSDAFKGQDAASLQVAPWDWHPNVKGHKLLADRLYEVLLRHEPRVGLKLAQARE